MSVSTNMQDNYISFECTNPILFFIFLFIFTTISHCDTDVIKSSVTQYVLNKSEFPVKTKVETKKNNTEQLKRMDGAQGKTAARENEKPAELVVKSVTVSGKSSRKKNGIEKVKAQKKTKK